MVGPLARVASVGVDEVEGKCWKVWFLAVV